MTNAPNYDTAIALVGMAGRFPGAPNIETFWQNLIAGQKSIRVFTDEELLAAGIEPETLAQPNYVKAGAVLEDGDMFDAPFFKFSPREAEITDPQHRVFLECAWAALEDAGYDPETYPDLIGVFAGSALSTYLMHNLYPNEEMMSLGNGMQAAIGNDKDSLASTVSYKLNLRGPAIAVQTFCSTSLVATHLACQSLLNYECDIALAGGVAVSAPQIEGYAYEEGGILSPDGECRTFDANGGGSVMGNGVGIVALKRLEEARQDGDQIYAVLLGSAVNNDGSVRVSYTAPGLSGQTEVIAQAMSNAQVEPETIGYIEAHGTATMLGDSVEVAAMTRAFERSTTKQQFCAIGSVKPNIGHLDRASGITGLIKAALILKHGQIPPSLNFQQANPDLHLESSPFYVNTKLRPWEDGEIPRRAGVSSFGVGGTNAHVVLEETLESIPSTPARPWQLLLLSARTEQALNAATANLATHLQTHADLNLADVAYTLQVGRSAFNYRRFIVCEEQDAALASLLAADTLQTSSAQQVYRDRPVTFLLSGAYGPSVDMSRSLYQEEPAFRTIVEDCLTLLSESQVRNVRKLFVDAPASMTEQDQHLLLFITEYALAKMLIQWGVSPQSLLGMGTGIYTAACVAGVFSLEDGLRISARATDPEQVLRNCTLSEPEIPLFSHLTGSWVTPEQATDPNFWLTHLSADSATTNDRLTAFLQETEGVLLELGGGQISDTLLQGHPAYSVERHAQVILLPAEGEQSGRAALLRALGQLWLAGCAIDWAALTNDEQRQRVSLPTYPFERQRYWLNSPAEQRAANRALALSQSSRNSDSANWFYRENWLATPLPQLGELPAKPHTWLVFLDTDGPGEVIARRLEVQKQRVIRVYASTVFEQTNEQHFQIRPDEQSDYTELCERLTRSGWQPERVLHCWSINGKSELTPTSPSSFRTQQETGFYSLLNLAKAVAAGIYDDPTQVIVLGENALAITGQEYLQAENISLFGACKTITQEPLNIFCRYIDLERSTNHNWEEALPIEALVAECLLPNNEPVVAYRDKQRLTQQFEAVTLPPVEPDALPFRSQGVYLITGGLGNIGLALAEHLATTVQARLVLLSRTRLPERADWSTWLANHDEQDSTSLKLRALQHVEASGGEVVLRVADITNPVEMQELVQETIAAFGALHGVFHAAGITSTDAFKTVQDISRDACELHFQAKVYGTLALAEALAGIDLDFCLLFSSLSAVLGGLGFTAYTAANLFLDTLVARQNQLTTQRWLSVNWDTWQFKSGNDGAPGATVLTFAMTATEGLEALTRVLASPYTRLVNSTGDLSARIRQWVSKEWPDESDEKQNATGAAVHSHVSAEEYEQKVSEIWQQILGIRQVGLYDNFFDLGGNSLVALDVISRLKKTFHRQIPVVALFEAPTVSAMVTYLQAMEETTPVKQASTSRRRRYIEQATAQEGIAIIGMTGRFPGSSTIEGFWENLRAGKETIKTFSNEELLAAGVDPAILRDPTYVKARPVLDQVDQFDANFFGYSPREAELTDPQHRLFLECAWEALESAGYDSQTIEKPVGVFGGANFSTYLLSLVASHPEMLQELDGFQLSIGNDKDSLTTTVSYKLNLRGPSFAVQTFCSTSLVATHLACQSLMLGECDMALAGGVSVRVPNRVGYFYQDGGQESSDGHCRTFDEQSQGSVLGDGVGIIVLKRLADALEDGDTIHAVIKGSAINNDGALKVSYSAPSVAGQAEVVSRALENAGVDAASIGYIEAHGTATKLGDPIEVASLTKAFRAQTEQTGYCAIGSVKTNMGHLDRAAGITGLMKAVLALKHEQIPASLHYHAPNPEIDFADSPFYVNTELSPWPRQAAPRRAGINSLGMGGTNVHVVIEEAPQQSAFSPDQPWQLLLLSARTETALQTMARNLHTYLREHAEVSLADVAYTLQVGRGVFEYRHALVCQDRSDALTALASVANGERAATYQTRRDQAVTLTPPAQVEERQAFLTNLGQSWLEGGKIDWVNLYADEKRQRIPLPTYPFERQRYWLEPDRQRRAATVMATAPVTIEREADPADWFYRATWTAEPLTETSPITLRYPWLIFAETGTPGELVAEQLETLGYPVTRVYAAQQFVQTDEHTFRIRPGESDDYVQLCATLAETGHLPRRILHGWSCSLQERPANSIEFTASQETGFYSLLFLAQGLAPHIYAEPVQLLVVTANAQPVQDQQTIRPECAPLLGACKVIQQEPLNIACRSIDLAISSSGEWEQSITLAQLLAECSGTATDLTVAYRDRTRLVERYQANPLPPLTESALPFRQHGVYLLTGGLGGIGLALAEHLARTVQARLILLARSPLPERQQWQAWLEQHAPEDALSIKIRRLQQIEDAGGQLLIRQVDVSNEQALQAVIQEAQETFGALNGVFHAAGIVDPSFFKSILDMTRAECEPHFQGKVHGTYALAHVLQDMPLDFCLLFSSLSAVLGGLGFVAYTASNLFLDSCAHLFNQTSATPWTSVNWDTWKVTIDSHGALGGTIAAFAMEPAEAIEALTRVLGNEQRCLVNSTGNLHARLAQWMNSDLLQESNASLLENNSAVTLIPSSGNYEQKIKEIWQEVLGVEEVGLYDNFFDLGGNSLIALEVIGKLKKAFRQPVPAVALFEAPTISMLVQYLRPAAPSNAEREPDRLSERREKTRQSVGTQGVALIGMSGRFPGAPTVEQFWDNLCQGVESISFFTPEELAEAGVPAELINAPNYVPARPVLPEEMIRGFDAAFFGYSPREAELTDPQHRIFLECAWEALELAGYDTQTYQGLVGVFGGTNISTYMLSAEPSRLEGVNNYQLLAGNDKDSLTTNVSYKLNLRGPSLAVQTFCSTSLVAVHLASQSLIHGECDLALAGGASICVPAVNGHLFEPGGMESPDGHCRTFDAKAKGSMFGDGVGVVALKRLEDALEDGDYIYGVIKGSAINNDGSLKVSYAAPSVAGQAEVVQTALANAGVSAESISYIEAHGTATELGDPIEVASLTKAFHTHTEKNGYCAIGSVKTNVGHLDRAAGISGLLKTMLALHHEQIPASLHYQSPNPEIDFEHSPFYVNTKLSPWPRTTTPRRAGINSLGMGGTNAHVVVEEAPLREPSGPSRPWQLLVFSARTETALEQIQQRFAAYLESHEDANLADIAYTLSAGRRRFEYRSVLLCRDRAEALKQLQEPLPSLVESRVDRPVSFLFSGVGEHYAGMAHELYQQEELFRKTIDECCDLLKDLLGRDIREILFATEPLIEELHNNGNGHGNGNGQNGNGHNVQNGFNLRALLGRAEKSHANGNGNGNGNGHHVKAQSESLRQTAIAQPALFVIEYALARQLMQWGIQPQAMLGYSLGEYVAACLAGVFSLEDALKLVAQRALLISELPTGSMLAVSLPETKVQPYLDTDICLAALNSPGTCVLSGETAAIETLAEQLTTDGVAWRRVETTHAFHSRMLEPISLQLTALVQKIKLHAPKIPYISNITGTWITPEQATDPAYWARHMCQTVQFADGVGNLLQETESTLLEVGPGQSLTSFVRQHPDCDRERMALLNVTLPAVQEKQSEQRYLLQTLGRLWQIGAPVDWSGFYSGERRQRLPLPTYPFERQSYWLGVRKGQGLSLNMPGATTKDTISNLPREALADWFYLPVWKQVAPVQASQTDESTDWLIFLDGCGLGLQLAKQLRASGETVSTVLPGTTFARLSDERYTVRPAERADYDELCRDLRSHGKTFQRIVHLWNVSDKQPEVEQILQESFYSLFTLAQTLGDMGSEQYQISIVSTGAQNVTGHEQISPARATLIGPGRVLPQEFPTLQCRAIDILLPQSGSKQEALVISQLLNETRTEITEPLIALRGQRRWVPAFEPMHLDERTETGIQLREGGVYLITGGLGGIGLAMAEFFAREAHAKIVLTGRTMLPPRQEWSEILQDQAEGVVAQRISKVLAIEALGSEVLTIAADVTDAAQMQAAIEQSESRFGTLHGIVHAAGLPGQGLTQLKTREQAAQVLAPKVLGTLAIEKALAERTLDFLVLCSSVVSATGGGPGQIDYCAANAFLDAYAQSRNDEGTPVISIDWGEWQWNAWEAGLSGYDPEVQDFLREHRQQFGIPFAEGTEALRRVLAAQQSHMVVSTQDFRVLAEQSRQFSAAALLQQTRELHQAGPAHPRPNLARPYAPPRNELEEQIAAIWEDLLGISPVGINDNFFELGGNSLNGIDLISRLRKTFGLESLASHVLYEASTVEAMARYIDKGTSNTTVKERVERGEKRRDSLKQRTHGNRKPR